MTDITSMTKSDIFQTQGKCFQNKYIKNEIPKSVGFLFLVCETVVFKDWKNCRGCLKCHLSPVSLRHFHFTGTLLKIRGGSVLLC